MHKHSSKQAFYAEKARIYTILKGIWQAGKGCKRHERFASGRNEASVAQERDKCGSGRRQARLENEASVEQNIPPQPASTGPFSFYLKCKYFDIPLTYCKLQKIVFKFGNKVKPGAKQTILSD